MISENLVNCHSEGFSQIVIIQPSSKSLISCSGFWCFFLRVSPNFCLGRHSAVRLTHFPVRCPNNSHNSLNVASGWSATNALTAASASVKGLNRGLPLCLGSTFPWVCCCLTSFCSRLLLTPNRVATFLAGHLSCQVCCYYFWAEVKGIGFPTLWLSDAFYLNS